MRLDETYFSEIGSVPALTANRERELCARLGAGADVDARNQLALGCLRLVVGIAGRMTRAATARGRLGLEVSDAVGVGNVALVRAAGRFDATRGRFSTYAGACIEGAVRKAQRAGMPGARTGFAVSLNALVMAEEIRDDRVRPPEEEVFSEIDRQRVRRLLDCIGTREGAVLRMGYGIDVEPLAGAEIARRLGVSRERVRQIKVQGLGRMRRALGGRQGAVTLRRGPSIPSGF
ncbi:MAG TPA: sigma-70 family RNA polymerase sigma factor [Phycisphaerae bacterium]|nr:sigma-70 family RNA polymerase sigma factor [Phycisphaerae bacterium]